MALRRRGQTNPLRRIRERKLPKVARDHNIQKADQANVKMIALFVVARSAQLVS